MIQIIYDPTTRSITLNGHAGAAEKGHDIVCAAASALTFTLAQMLFNSEKMLEKPARFRHRDGEGYARISCKPRPEHEKTVALMYRYALTGFEMLARDYPDNVSFAISE